MKGKHVDMAREAAHFYNLMVKRAEDGDIEARKWLISSPRGDSKTDSPQYWQSYEEWRAWNQQKGNAIRKMVHQTQGAGG